MAVELSSLSKKELLNKCSELGIIKCSSKNKLELIQLINNKNIENQNIENQNIEQPINNSNNIKMIDLFTGTGAFSLAFNETNIYYK
jgi:hypothetical protein